MNRALAERLRMVDFLLDHFGFFQRKHLMDYFGISPVQASNDLNEYQHFAPTNMRYDVSARMYRKTENFKRLFP
jgi:hypothetical protein